MVAAGLVAASAPLLGREDSGPPHGVKGLGGSCGELRLSQAAAEIKAARAAARSRTRSWCDAEARAQCKAELGGWRLLHEPGGFRRFLLHSQAEAPDLPEEWRPIPWARCITDELSPEAAVRLYGFNVPSESLEDLSSKLPPDGQHGFPLKGLSSLGAGIAIFKGNLTCGILFTPAAARNGGFLLWPVMLAAVFVLSAFCAVRLMRCRASHGAGNKSYGDLMELAAGPWGRVVANASIVLLQSGACALYLIFVAQVLQSMIAPSVPLDRWIAALILLEAPLVLLRKVSKLWVVSLTGSALVLAGAFAVMRVAAEEVSSGSGADVSELRAVGAQPLVALGTACFVVEGIGLVIPTLDSCKEPQRFPAVYTTAMALVLLIATTLSLLGYSAYGDSVQALVLLNLPQGQLQDAIRLMFGFAVFFTFPLQLLPALCVLESYSFEPMSNPPFERKCRKSCFRLAYVVVLAVVAVFGASSLSNFVSIVGSLCGMPLAFVFPSLCHYKLASSTVPSAEPLTAAEAAEAQLTAAGGRQQPGLLDRGFDLGLAGLGVLGTVVVTAVNVAAWGQGG